MISRRASDVLAPGATTVTKLRGPHYFAPRPITENDLVMGMEWEPQLTLLRYPNTCVDVAGVNARTFTRADVLSPSAYAVFRRVGCKPAALVRIPIDPDSGCMDGFQRVGVDLAVKNLEVRSRPVLMREWEAERRACQAELEQVVCAIAKVAGPTGVFLPGDFKPAASDCLTSDLLSKHLNLSCAHLDTGEIRRLNRVSEMDIEPGGTVFSAPIFRRLFFGDEPAAFSSSEAVRVHACVPYHWTDYGRLTQQCLSVANATDTTPAEWWLDPEGDCLFGLPVTRWCLHEPTFLGYSQSGDSFVRYRDHELR